MHDDIDLAVRDHWDGAATVYDRLHSHGLFSEAEREAWCGLLRRVLPPAPARVLDAGTGTAFLALRAAEAGYEVVGVDVSPEMLAGAREAISRHPDGQRITVVPGDADLEGVAPASFDAVISRHLLWTLPQPEVTLRRWRDVLIPGGVAVAIDGTWFATTSAARARARVGRALRALAGAPREPGGTVYGRRGAETFPLMAARSPVPARNAFERAGFVDVRAEHLDGIDAVERRSMPLADRLTYGWRRYLVEGRRPVG